MGPKTVRIEYRAELSPEKIRIKYRAVFPENDRIEYRAEWFQKGSELNTGLSGSR
jgi:hypothetical protein